MKSIFAAGLMAALAAAPITAANAAVVFTATQTSPTFASPGATSQSPTVNLFSTLTVTVSDTAAANGFSVNVPRGYSTGSGTPQLDGLLSIVLQVFQEGRQVINYGLSDFLRQSQQSGQPIHYFTLSAVAGGLLSGEVYGNNTNTDSRILLNGTASVTGFAASDDYNAVCYSPGCTFTGIQTRTGGTPAAVPEPMSIALFGAGLAGLAMVRRRKA